MKFRDLIDFRKPKTPGYGICKGFYMSVLSPTPHLPAPQDWVAPTGPLQGMIAPLAAGGKELLARPMQRGSYAITSLDKKSVLRCVVVCKEEAGFDPHAYLAHPCSQQLHADIRDAIASTWILVQLSFEGHDPMVVPSMHLLLSLVSRLAEQVGGVVADPLAEDYLCPHEAVPSFPPEGPMNATQVVRIHSPKPGIAHTLGMRKFGLPELEMKGFQPDHKGHVAALLSHTAQTVLETGPLTVGSTVGARDCALKVVAGGQDRGRWEGIPCLELVPANPGAMEKAIISALELN